MSDVAMDEINRLVSMQLGVRDVKDNSLLAEDLGAESADVANIVAVLEEKYQITVTEPEMAKTKRPPKASRILCSTAA